MKLVAGAAEGADEVRPYPDTEGGLKFLKSKGLKVLPFHACTS